MAQPHDSVWKQSVSPGAAHGMEMAVSGLAGSGAPGMPIRGPDGQLVMTQGIPTGPVLTPLHPHPLINKGPETRGWTCDCASQPSGCMSAGHGQSHQMRFRCEACDFDVCGPCFARATGMMPPGGPIPTNREMNNQATSDTALGCFMSCFFCILDIVTDNSNGRRRPGQGLPSQR